jgi:hypothetical protein
MMLSLRHRSENCRRFGTALALAFALLCPGGARAQLGEKVVDALSGAMTSISSMLTLETSVTSNAAKAAATQDMFSEQAAKDAIVNTSIIPDTNDTLCRLHTARSMKNTMNDYNKAVGKSLETGLNDLATNRSYTPSRLAVGWLYRLCKNGQLRRGTAPDFADSDFGPKWFAANACIDSPVQTHAFLNPTTILDHSILVSPSKDQMDVLNNPESAYPPNPPMPGGTPETVWAALTDKQKLFVGAKLFCENLSMSRINPIHFTSDQAMMPGNMQAITNRLSSNGLMATAQSLCQHEVARRTAPDPESPDLAADPAMQIILTRGEKVATFLTGNESKNMEDIYAYLTDATGANTGAPVVIGAGVDAGKPKAFISPYLIDRFGNDYCDSQDTADNFAFKQGSEAVRSGTSLDCLTVTARWQLNDIAHRLAFSQTVLGMPDMDSNGEPQAAPAKANYKGNNDWRNGTLLRNANFIDGLADDRSVSLNDMMQSIKSTAHPTKLAVTGDEGVTP